jgi:voltage-gated potassium channel
MPGMASTEAGGHPERPSYPSVAKVRASYNRFVADHDVAWELTMAALAIAFVAIGFLGDAASEPTRGWLAVAEWSLTALFAAEFASRFAASLDRRAYLREHWIDVVALVPVLREFRILRLLRLLRLVRAFAGIYRVLNHVGRLANHRGLAWLLVTWLGVMVICSLLMYSAENGLNKAVASPFDALWWGIVTLTTVGYGDVVPRTTEGRIAASALMLLGIGLFSAITATMTSFMLEGRAHPASESGERLGILDELRESGLVTPDEYVAQRAQILGSLTPKG